MISLALKIFRLALLHTVVSGGRILSRKIVIDTETALLGDSTHFHFISSRHQVSPGSLIQSQLIGVHSVGGSANQSHVALPDQSIPDAAPDTKQVNLNGGTFSLSSVDSSANQSQLALQDQSIPHVAPDMKQVNIYRGPVSLSSVDRSANQSQVLLQDQSILPSAPEMKQVNFNSGSLLQSSVDHSANQSQALPDEQPIPHAAPEMKKVNLYRGPLLQSSVERSAKELQALLQDHSVLPVASQMKHVTLYRGPVLQSSVDGSANQSKALPPDQSILPGVSEMKRVNLYSGPHLESSVDRSAKQPQDQSIVSGVSEIKQVTVHRGPLLQPLRGLPDALPSRIAKVTKGVKKDEAQDLTTGEASHDRTKASISSELGSLIEISTSSHHPTKKRKKEPQDFNVSPVGAYEVGGDQSMSKSSFEEVESTGVVDYMRAGLMVIVLALIATAHMTRKKAAGVLHKDGPRMEPTVPLTTVNKAEYLENSDVESFLQCPENRYCADCRVPGAEWASVNLGVFLCIECAGVHRGLGVRISRVQSLDMDDWKDEWIKTCREVGNGNAKDYYEHGDVGNLRFEHGMSSDDPKKARHLRELWIRSKYEFRAFVADDMV